MSEQISRLIGTICDTALDPELWPRALEGVCGFVGGSRANMFWQDVVAKTARKYFEWGKYSKISPLFRAVYTFPVEYVFSQSDITPPEVVREIRFYKEWVQPQGYIDFIACNLEKLAASCLPTAVIRDERDGWVARMRLLEPHIRRAALIGNVISLQMCNATTLADTLDGLVAGLFLVAAAALCM